MDKRTDRQGEATTEQQRAAIDATFVALTHDDEFQAESVGLAEEGAASSWEALRLAEQDVPSSAK